MFSRELVQFTETAQNQSLRAAHLRAKGAIIVNCGQRSFAYEVSNGSTSFAIHEADILNEEAQKAGLRCVSVSEARPEEVGVAEVSTLLSDLLGLDEQIKLVRLEASSEAVIRDYAGRLLNTGNEEIREILAILPEAVGNPVRHALLQIYLDCRRNSPTFSGTAIEPSASGFRGGQNGLVTGFLLNTSRMKGVVFKKA